MVDEYAAKNPGRVYAATSLGQIRYLSALKYCDAVIGNSSSGIVEAPGMHKPAVNLGERQSGRLKADSVIDCAEQEQSIIDAIERALSGEFRAIASKAESLYGNCDASTRMKAFLKQVDLASCPIKRFYDLHWE